ncbi:MAG TPA: DUF5687 family protein, partial [Flavobacterium sp.]|nr:DUF5687 family protein [Flavobacterium sp.]
MFRRFLRLEWKAFTRSSAFGSSVILKIFLILGAIYFIGLFLILGFAAFSILKDNGAQDPLLAVSKYAFYYFILDLIMRIFLQKIPVINIRPLLVMPIKRSTVVNFAIGKTLVSFFNVVHAFFFIPFTIMAIANDYDPIKAIFWHL